MNEDFLIENGVLVKYNGTDEIVTIPEGVHMISNGAFYNDYDTRKTLKEVIIPKGVQGIGYCAFMDCTSLEKVILPTSLKAIGDLAFLGCGSLKYLDFLYGLKQIGRGAFEECQALTRVKIPASVTTIGKGAFKRCMEVESVWLPEHLKKQVKLTREFKGCKKILSGRFSVKPNTVFWYSDSPRFSVKNNVLELYGGPGGIVTIPENVVKIGKHAFVACFDMCHVVFPSGLKEIGEMAFAGVRLERVDLPDGLLKVDDWAFGECGVLETVTIPFSVIKIGVGAFGYCERLKRVRIPEHLREQVQVNNVFGNCDALSRENIEWYDEETSVERPAETRAEIPPDTRPEIPPETVPMLPETNTVARDVQTEITLDSTKSQPESNGNSRSELEQAMRKLLQHRQEQK